jgi:hypothetical protein
MTAFPADSSSSSPRGGRFGFVSICIVGLVAGGIAGWRLLSTGGELGGAGSGHAVRAAMVATPPSDTAPLVLAQDANTPSVRKDSQTDLRAFGGLTGLRAAPTNPPEGAGVSAQPDPVPQPEPSRQGNLPKVDQPKLDLTKPDLTKAELTRPVETKPADARPTNAPVKPPESPVVASVPPLAEPALVERKSLAVETVTPTQPGAESALPDGEQAQFIQMAAAMIRRGDIAGARVVLGRLYRQGSKVAAFQLAQTYDPLALRGWNVRGLRGDEERARGLYEEAATAGIPEAAARLKALAVETKK